MAAYIQVSQLLFIGASTDTKPTNNVTPVGAQCLEYTAATSTSKFFMNDGTAWRDLSDPYLAAIKAKTDNLPASPAAVGSAMTLTAAYDAAKTAAADTEVAKIPKSDGTASWNATAIAALQAAAQAAITASALGTAAELAKVPKSDAAVTFNATALGSINAEVDTALNTIVPASPTAGSLNDALSKAAGGNTFNKATDSFEAIRDRMDALAEGDLLTTFGQETAGATNANGVTWVDLLDKTVLVKRTKICGAKLTVAGGWAGIAAIRIVTSAGVKIWPFIAEFAEGTDWTTAVQMTFNFEVLVPAATGYKVQFRSSAAGDGAGKTLALNNLDIITLG